MDSEYSGDHDLNFYRPEDSSAGSQQWRDEQMRLRVERMKAMYRASADMTGRHLRLQPVDEKVEFQSPDMRPSRSRLITAPRGDSYVCVMEIKDEVKLEGAVVLRATSDPATGRLVFNGLSILTRDEILFD